MRTRGNTSLLALKLTATLLCMPFSKCQVFPIYMEMETGLFSNLHSLECFWERQKPYSCGQTAKTKQFCIFPKITREWWLKHATQCWGKHMPLGQVANYVFAFTHLHLQLTHLAFKSFMLRRRYLSSEITANVSILLKDHEMYLTLWELNGTVLGNTNQWNPKNKNKKLLEYRNIIIARISN